MTGRARDGGGGGACSWLATNKTRVPAPRAVETHPTRLSPYPHPKPPHHPHPPPPQVIAASYFEDEVQKRAVLTRFSVPEAAAVRGSPEAEGVAAALDAAAAAVSAHRGVTLSLSQVAGRASGSLARERGRMVATLRALSRADLNAVLPNVCLAAVLEAGGPPVADVLASRAPSGRLDELGVLARAALVDALQKLGLRGRAQRQAWAAAAILATRGIDLTRVKVRGERERGRAVLFGTRFAEIESIFF